MNAIKPGTKTRLRIFFSVLLCAIIIGTTPRVMREFYYRGAFIHYRGILRLVLLIMLPLLLLSYIAFISELKQSQKKLMLNVIRWYGVILYCAIKVHPEKNIRFVCAADCVGMHRDSAAGFGRRGF